MIPFFPKAKIYIAVIAILMVFVLTGGSSYLWQYRVKQTGKVLSDQQMVWLLVGLLVIAFISMGAFLLVLLRGF